MTPARTRWVPFLLCCACQADPTSGGTVDAATGAGGIPTGGEGGQGPSGGGAFGGAADASPPPPDATSADARVPVDGPGLPQDAAGPDAAAPDAAGLDAALRDALASDAAPVSTAAGRPCALDADCGEGYACNTEIEGGYCLPGAPGGPTACRPPEAECPPETLCSPLPWHAISGVCMLACESDEDCRQGHACAVVELFPGEPDTPHSPGPVCWVRRVCEFGRDQTCNDDPAINSLHGRCRMDGSCECNDGFPRNEETGRCR